MVAAWARLILASGSKRPLPTPEIRAAAGALVLPLPSEELELLLPPPTVRLEARFT